MPGQLMQPLAGVRRHPHQLRGVAVLGIPVQSLLLLRGVTVAVLGIPVQPLLPLRMSEGVVLGIPVQLLLPEW